MKMTPHLSLLTDLQQDPNRASIPCRPWYDHGAPAVCAGQPPWTRIAGLLVRYRQL